MSEFIRQAALELQLENPEEIVRMAGVIQRIKNWIKYRTDSEYKTVVDTLRQDSAGMKSSLEEISGKIETLQAAIRDGEPEIYHANLAEIKKLMLGLWQTVKQTTEDSKDYYSAEDVESPGFADWFKKHLPEGYELELNKDYALPLKSTRQYANLTPDKIRIGERVLTLIKHQITKLNIGLEEFPEVFKNDQLLVVALLEAAAEGTLLRVEAKKPYEKNPKLKGGTTQLEILTQPLTLPGTDLQVQGQISVIDYQDKMSISGSRRWKFLGKQTLAGLKIEEMIKLALDNVPQKLKYTEILEQDLAKVLRMAYLKVFGSDPTAEVLAGGWAQAVLEAGRPLKFPNNNIGNIKAVPAGIKAGQSYFLKSTVEYSSSGEKRSVPNEAWAAFPTLEAGAEAYWKLIDKKYNLAHQWMAAGDPISATVALAQKHYFTANIEKYAAGVKSLYQEFLTKIAPNLSGLKSAPAAAPGPKPEVKEWLDHYKDSDKKLVSPIIENKEPQQGSTEIDSLIKNLTAYGPLTSLVKHAILKQILPETQTVILVQGGKPEIQLEFARLASYFCHKFLDSRIEVCQQSNKIELQAITLGTPLKVVQAQQALCDLLSEKMSPTATVIAGFKSQLPLVKNSELQRNSRSLQLQDYHG